MQKKMALKCKKCKKEIILPSTTENLDVVQFKTLTVTHSGKDGCGAVEQYEKSDLYLI
jgi:hypothetical protein